MPNYEALTPEQVVQRNREWMDEYSRDFNPEHERFYFDSDNREVRMVYYNPDSSCGGQFVECLIDVEQLLEENPDSYSQLVDILIECGTQYTEDIDQPFFTDTFSFYQSLPENSSFDEIMAFCSEHVADTSMLDTIRQTATTRFDLDDINERVIMMHSTPGSTESWITSHSIDYDELLRLNPRNQSELINTMITHGSLYSLERGDPSFDAMLQAYNGLTSTYSYSDIMQFCRNMNERCRIASLTSEQREQLNQRSENMPNNKIDLKEQKFGVELEFTGISRQETAEIVANHFGTSYTRDYNRYYDRYIITDNQGRDWKISSDSSIETSISERSRGTRAEHQVELITPVCNYSDIDDIQKLVRKCRAKGAVSNASCGMHIHVDGKNHTPDSIVRLTKIMYCKEDILYRALGVKEERERFCQKVSEDFFQKIRDIKNPTTEDLRIAWYGSGYDTHRRYDHYDRSRYRALNLHNYLGNFPNKNTVEFRCFNSVMEHAGKVKAYIQFALAVSAQAINQKKAGYIKTASENECYTFRTWLIRIGLNGEEFETCRHHLLANLEGDKAWKNREEAMRRRAERAELLAEQIDVARQASPTPDAFSIADILNDTSRSISATEETAAPSLREQLNNFLSEINAPEVSIDERNVIMDILNRRVQNNNQNNSQTQAHTVAQPSRPRGRR